MARVVIRMSALLVAALLPLCSAAMGPNDPFTPPAPGLPAAETNPSNPSTMPVASGLAGVRLGSAPAALIDGEWLRPGQTVRGARLAAVRLDAAVLRHPDGRTEQLLLFPTPPSTPPAEAAGVSMRTAPDMTKTRGQP